MNRRDFLRRVLTPVVVAMAEGGATETGVQTQEQKVLDNSLTELVSQAQEKVIINYPDKFKPLTPEVEEVLLSIQAYQTTILDGNLPDENFYTGQQQQLNQIGDKDKIDATKLKLWTEFKKIGIKLGEYSDDIFYRTLLFEIPKRLAEYGIYIRFSNLNISRADSAGLPVAFEQSEILFLAFQIGKIERDVTEQGKNKVPRNILYIQGPAQVHGRPLYSDKDKRIAEAAFPNIMIFEEGLDIDLKYYAENFEELNRQKGTLQFRQQELIRTDAWSSAVEVATVKIGQKTKTSLSREELKEQSLAHETRHLIEDLTLDLKSFWPFQKTTNPAIHNARGRNVLVHEELGPILAQLRYGPRKEFTLISYLVNARDISTPGGTYAMAEKWIIKKMIDIISSNPAHYGMELVPGPVNKTNQILSQFDLLIDRPDLLDGLCDKLIQLHNQNLGEHIIDEVSNPGWLQGEKVEESLVSKMKVPAGVVIGAGAAAYGAKRWMNRRQEVAAEEAKLKGMSRTERREYERQKAKGKK